MTQSTDLQRLIVRIRTELIDADRLISPPGYGHITLSLIDAVFSIRARYASVRRVVMSYCEAAGVPDASLDAATESGFLEHTLDDFLSEVATHADPSALFSHARGKSGGRLKSELCIEAAQRLVASGISKRSQLLERFTDPNARDAWVGVKGLGWITWQYFGSLNGLQQVKPDIHVVAFVETTLGKSASPREVDQLVHDAASSLSVPVRSLEHSIWRLGSKWENGSQVEADE